MRALRSIAITLLAVLGVVGAVGAVLWSGSLAGLARAQVVTTSAMAPEYQAGDLVVVTTTPVAELRAGDVVSVRAAGSGSARLERVVATAPAGEGSWRLATTASGGAASEHEVGAETWAPSLRVPVVGGIVAAALEPRYAIPAVALVLLLGAIVLIGRAPSSPARRAL